MIKFIWQYSSWSLFTLINLVNTLLILVIYIFLDNPETLPWENLVTVISSLLLYTIKLLVGYFFLSLFILLLSDKVTLEENSFSSLIKVLLVSDLINVFGDILHTLILVTNSELTTNNMLLMYNSYPLSLANLLDWNILIAGIFKDINVFQFISIVVISLCLYQEFKINKSLSLKIAALTSLSSLFIINLCWSFIIITLQNGITKLG